MSRASFASPGFISTGPGFAEKWKTKGDAVQGTLLSQKIPWRGQGCTLSRAAPHGQLLSL